MAQVKRDRNLDATIKLTRDEANKLECYFLMSSEFRKNEIETWQDLANEKDENGNPRFTKAVSNAEWFKKMDEFINDIVNGLRGY